MSYLLFSDRFNMYNPYSVQKKIKKAIMASPSPANSNISESSTFPVTKVGNINKKRLLEGQKQHCNNNTNFKKHGLETGTAFNDYDDLTKAIQEYQTLKHVKLYRRDSRSIKSMINTGRSPKKNFSMKLKYGELSFRCIFGGKIYKSFSKGFRPRQSSFKQGCEMHIRFGVSDDGSQLVVKSMSEEHNHEINEETVVKEALHPELCSYVSKLVWSDITISIDDVKRLLEDYVIYEMFKDQATPPRTRRQYFPSKKQIRYFMAKAKASLDISQEAELKLEAQAEKLKESHSDEKMIFNFKVRHDLPMDLTVTPDETMNETAEDYLESEGNDTKIDIQRTGESDNAKLLFCHQTPKQQRLLKRYSSQVILTEVKDIHSKIPFPLFCLYVQTNVNYQLVGEFILQSNTTAMIMEGLQAIKDWNPGWNPKFVVVDFTDEQITAVENIFPGTLVLISDASREQAWSDWLSTEQNGVAEHKEEVLTHLQAIANSYSEDTLNAAARELEESEVWKLSDKMRNWFQVHWLAQAKRWVAGYRPDDYLMTSHIGRTMDDELKVFKNIKLANKSNPLQDVIQQLVEHVVPVASKQYALLNQESFKLQKELYYLYADIPNYLSCHPGKLTFHVYERIKAANEQSFTISYLHPGIFSVQGTDAEDEMLHTVSFGDMNAFPSCDCSDWQQFKLPCIHFCAVFNNYPGWTWDMLSVGYKSCPVLNVDWTTITTDYNAETPGNLVDNSTQTSAASLLSNPSEFSKMPDSKRVSDTPQVLATQCRGLMQQLSKLQLAHHSRENLYRLKSDLKDLIAVFSSTPKQKQPLLNPGLSGSYIVQSGKGPGRPRKINIPTSSATVYVTHQPAGSDQFSAKQVTPKQVSDAGDRKTYPVRVRSSSSELNINKPDTATASSQENIISAVYIVDPRQVLSSTITKQPSGEEEAKVDNQSRKRIKSPSVFLKPPAEKRLKEEEEAIDDSNQPDSLQRGISLEFPDEEAPDTALLADSSMANVIDGNSISVPLEQVSIPLETSGTQLSEIDTSAFVTSSTVDNTETMINDPESVVK